MSDYRPDDPTNPEHYRTTERECIDLIRDKLGDEGFLDFCQGNAMKYRHRAGLKSGTTAEVDIKKAEWYEMMYDHVLYGMPEHFPDPRQEARGDAFVPYKRRNS